MNNENAVADVNTFDMDGLTEEEEVELKKLTTKKETAKNNRKNFYDTLFKHKKEVMRVLGYDDDGKPPLTKEEEWKIYLADVVKIWGAQNGLKESELVPYFINETDRAMHGKVSKV